MESVPKGGMKGRAQTRTCCFFCKTCVPTYKEPNWKHENAAVSISMHEEISWK